MRDRKKHVDWNKRLKNAAIKAAITRKRSRAGKKAAATRAKNSRNLADKNGKK